MPSNLRYRAAAFAAGLVALSASSCARESSREENRAHEAGVQDGVATNSPRAAEARRGASVGIVAPESKRDARFRTALEDAIVVFAGSRREIGGPFLRAAEDWEAAWRLCQTEACRSRIYDDVMPRLVFASGNAQSGYPGLPWQSGVLELETGIRSGTVSIFPLNDGQIVVRVNMLRTPQGWQCDSVAHGRLDRNGMALMTPVDDWDPNSRYVLRARGPRQLRLDRLSEAGWNAACRVGYIWGEYRVRNREAGNPDRP